jgi:hypothetical protein
MVPQTLVRVYVSNLFQSFMTALLPVILVLLSALPRSVSIITGLVSILMSRDIFPVVMCASGLSQQNNRILQHTPCRSLTVPLSI